MEKENTDMKLVKLAGGQLLRIRASTPPPEGAEIITIDDSKSDEEIAALYREVVGTAPKKFKTRELALASVVYQIAKLALFDPNSPIAKSVARKSSSGKTKDKPPAEPKAPKVENLRLAQPEAAADLLGKMPPQARELVAIVTDLTAKVGGPFTYAALVDFVKQDDVAPRLKTRQPPERILAYYKSRLMADGFLIPA